MQVKKLVTKLQRTVNVFHLLTEFEHLLKVVSFQKNIFRAIEMGGVGGRWYKVPGM